MIELLAILILILIALEIYRMATLADVSTKLDTVIVNVAALQAAVAAAPSQQAIDDLNTKAAVLVTNSTPPTPAS